MFPGYGGASVAVKCQCNVIIYLFRILKQIYNSVFKNKFNMKKKQVLNGVFIHFYFLG